MVERNEVSWNAIITGFAYTGCNVEALNVFRFMIDARVTPNSITISSPLPLLGELGQCKLGKEIHGYSLRMGIESDVFIANSLIDMYAKLGYSSIASTIFNKMGERNIVSWNSMLANFAQNKLEFAAVDLDNLHGICLDLVVSNSLIDMYAKYGCLNLAESVFDISPRNEVSYNILIIGYSGTSNCSISLDLFSEMRLSGMRPDIVSFMSSDERHGC
ncbi:hypothetical protein L6164_037037 [Bauhinia variegata]|uniref:Uncharacterized protein n=1 Tax=Bauhinia variegata TaxID=167791 RepID=A0ACB9KIW9_BAUVA|nr:hypothetical protein L6164_037037 [Bauhinia variegata]